MNLFILRTANVDQKSQIYDIMSAREQSEPVHFRLFLAKDFETMEASVFIDVMGWARNDYHYGVEVVNEPVVKADNIITSYCPQTAPDVAFMLLKCLIGAAKMQIVKSAMGFEFL